MSSQGCHVNVAPEGEAALATSIKHSCVSCGLQLTAQVLEWRETLAKLSSTYELLTSDSNALCKLMRNLPVVLYYCGPSACPLPVQQATIMLAHVADDALRPVSAFMAPIVSLCTGSLKSAGELNVFAEPLWRPFPGGLDETLLAPYLDILDDYLQERVDRHAMYRNRWSRASPSNVVRIQPLSTCMFLTIISKSVKLTLSRAMHCRLPRRHSDSNCRETDQSFWQRLAVSWASETVLRSHRATAALAEGHRSPPSRPLGA